MRNIKYLLLFILLSFIGIINYSALDKDEKVYDYANVLTFEEKELLKSKIEEFIETYNMDMLVVTVRYHNYSSTMSYADEFYDTNEFGLNSTQDGLICVIDFSTNHDDFWISTKGQAIIMYDDVRIDKILDSMDDEYYNNKIDYYSMFNAFIDKSSYYASLGIPESNKNVKLDKNGKPYVETKFPFGAITVISMIVSTITVLVIASRNKMIHKAKNADLYIDKDSVKITKREDRFITTHTTRTRISSDSSSGSGRAGGSSFHSSSGGFHGGGGRSH